MANKYRGESELVEQDGTKHTVRLGTAALCLAEALTGKPFAVLLDGLTTTHFSLTTLRALLQAGIVREKRMTTEEAGDLIDRAGVSRCQDAIGAALEHALHIADDDKKEGSANPPEASASGS